MDVQSCIVYGLLLSMCSVYEFLSYFRSQELQIQIIATIFSDNINVIGDHFMHTYGRFQKTSRFCLMPKSIIDYHLLC